MKFKGGSKFSEELEKLITKAHDVLNEDKKNLIINSHDKKFVKSMDTTNFFESLENANDITTVQALYNRLILELKPSIFIEFLLSMLSGKIPCGRVRGLYNVVEKYLIIGWLELVKKKFPDSDDYKYTGLGASWIRNILRPAFREMIIDNERAKSVYGRTRNLCISEEIYLRDVDVYKIKGTNTPDPNCVKAQKNYVTDKQKFLSEYSLNDSCPNPETIIEKNNLKDAANNDINWLKLVESALRANPGVTTDALLTYCDNAEELGITLEEEEEKKCEEIEMGKMPSDETLDKGMKVSYRGQEFTIESVPNDKFTIVNLNGTTYHVNAKQIKKIPSTGGKSIKLNKRNKKSKKHIKKSNNKKYSIKQHYKK
jgi:hypothetical protein